MKDTILNRVYTFFKERTNIGIKKYGKTLDNNTEDDFTQHLIEELGDAIQYLMKRQMDFESGEYIRVRKDIFNKIIELNNELTKLIKNTYYE